RRAVLDQRAERPGVSPSGGADVRAPVLHDPGRAVARLHARDHTELREAREVVGVHALDVYDLMAGVARAVDVARVLHRIERRPDPAVTGRVREGLEASPFELRDQLGEPLRRVEGSARG